MVRKLRGKNKEEKNYINFINYIKTNNNCFQNKESNKKIAIAEYNLGKIYYKKGNYGLARKHYQEAILNNQEAINLSYKDWEAYTNLAAANQNLGFTYEKIGDYELTEKHYKEARLNSKEAIKLNPKNSQGYINLAAANQNLGLLYEKDNYELTRKYYKEARLNSKKAIKLNPKDSQGYINLAATNQSLGNLYDRYFKHKLAEGYYKEAIINSEEVIEINFEDAENYIQLSEGYIQLMDLNSSLGLLYRGEHNYKLAEEYYKEAIINSEEAIKLDPKNSKIYESIGLIKQNLGFIYHSKNNYELAEEYYKESRLNCLKSKYYNPWNSKNYSNLSFTDYSLSELYYQIGENGLNKKYYKEAIINSKEALKFNPKNSSFYLNLGIFYYLSRKDKVKNLNKSIKNIWKAYKLTPNSMRILFYSGKVLIEYLKTPEGKTKTKNYLKIKKLEEKDISQEIDMLVEIKCYFLINNLKEINSLDYEIKEYLKLEIETKFRKLFKDMGEKFKIKKTNYKNRYYMYKSINNNLLFSLNERKLRKGNPYLFNDPFDPYYKEYFNGKSPIIIEDALKKIRISCFGEKNNSLLMWAHYGNQHKGLCIEYKKLKDKIDDFTCFEKVIYEEIKTHKEIKKGSNLLIDEMKIDEELLTINEMCLRKHKDWEYENEWRIISLEEEDENELYYENMEISKIFFGMKCEESNIRLIMKLLKDREEIVFCKMIQDDNLTLNNREIILDENGKIKFKPKNKKDKQLKIKGR